nr:MAG TPA: hypothetical protein [Crassvirales sp.]
MFLCHFTVNLIINNISYISTLMIKGSTNSPVEGL